MNAIASIAEDMPAHMEKVQVGKEMQKAREEIDKARNEITSNEPTMLSALLDLLLTILFFHEPLPCCYRMYLDPSCPLHLCS